MHPDLERARADIAATTGGLDEAWLARRPPGKWSAADTLEHLTRTFAGTAAVMARALEQRQPKGRARVRLAERVTAAIVVNLGYFPAGRQAPESTRPAGMSPGEVRRAIDRALVELDLVAARAVERFGARARVSNHPILGPLTVDQWRRFHRVHTRHHMKQIERMREHMP